MEKNSRKGQGETLSNVICIADERLRDHLGKIVLGSVAETLNALLSLCLRLLKNLLDLVPVCLRKFCEGS